MLFGAAGKPVESIQLGFGQDGGHAQNVVLIAGATGDEIEQVAAILRSHGRVTEAEAEARAALDAVRAR
jgi:hypothetical protein